MANEQQTRFAAQAKHQKPVFAIRTLFVEELDGELIVENSPCLVERNPVLSLIRSRLDGIPLEFDHIYIVFAPHVIATGGGAVLREANRVALRRHSTVVYLRSTPEELFRRLRHDTQRPLLQVRDPMQKLRDLHRQRDPLYEQTAHYIIDTGRPSIATLVNMILMQLELAGLLDAAVVPSSVLPPLPKH